MFKKESDFYQNGRSDDWKGFEDEKRLEYNAGGNQYLMVRVERECAWYSLKYFIIYLELWGNPSDMLCDCGVRVLGKFCKLYGLQEVAINQNQWSK